MLGRIVPVMPAGQHRQRAAFEAGAMRRLVDAARQPRDDDKAGLAEIARQRACEFQSGTGSVARTDHREHRPLQRIQCAAHAKQRRRIIQRGEPRRIAGFIRRQQADADTLAGVSSARASSSLQIRPGRSAPPRRARSGSRCSATRALPK